MLIIVSPSKIQHKHPFTFDNLKGLGSETDYLILSKKHSTKVNRQNAGSGYNGSCC